MRDQLAAEKAPGDQAHGDHGQRDTHGQCSDETVGVALVLDQEEQATEQAHDGRDQHQGNGGFEHGLGHQLGSYCVGKPLIGIPELIGWMLVDFVHGKGSTQPPAIIGYHRPAIKSAKSLSEKNNF